MHPAPLMQPLMDVVPGVKVTAQHSAEIFANQLFDHFSCTRMMVLVVAKCGSTDGPDVAIAAIFSPPRLIGLDSRTSADLPLELSEVGLHVFFEPMQQFHNLSDADRDPVQVSQINLDLANRQTHHRTLGSDEASQPHADPSLAYHLLVEIDRGFIPFL